MKQLEAVWNLNAGSEEEENEREVQGCELRV